VGRFLGLVTCFRDGVIGDPGVFFYKYRCIIRILYCTFAGGNKSETEAGAEADESSARTDLSGGCLQRGSITLSSSEDRLKVSKIASSSLPPCCCQQFFTWQAVARAEATKIYIVRLESLAATYGPTTCMHGSC